MHHARWRMSRSGHYKGVNLADFVAIPVLEKRIKLRPVPLEICTFVEYFSKCLLDFHDPRADAYFTAQLFLQIRSARQMVGMDMGFDDPFQSQLV